MSQQSMNETRGAWASLGFETRSYFIPLDAGDEVFGAVAQAVGRRLLEIAEDGFQTDKHVIMADRRRNRAVSPDMVAAMDVQVQDKRRKLWQDLRHDMLEYARMHHHHKHVANSPPAGATREDLAQWLAKSYAYSWLLAGAYYTLKADIDRRNKEKVKTDE